MQWNHFVSKIIALSKVGIKYSKDPYALENYEELHTLALQQVTELSNPESGFVLYPKEAYPTPNISVRIIVFNENHELLMVQERDDGLYCVPGGWCDVFESAQENAIKEVKQETGLEVKIDRLLGVFMRDRHKPKASMVSEYGLYFSAHVVGGVLQHNHETLSVAYYDLNNLPVLSRKTSDYELTTALEVAHEMRPVYFE